VIKSINNDFNVANRTLAAKFRVRHDKNCSRIHFQFPLAEVKKFCDPSLFVREFEVNETVTGVDATDVGKLKFFVDRKIFSENVIKTTLSRPIDYQWSRNALFPDQEQHILVEFSSPNIAKPFHIGHFRSTIIGNFVANIHRKIGNKVTKINYLGDWGTQFGVLLAGLEKDKELKYQNMGISDLLQIYIKSSKSVEEDCNHAETAKNAFYRLEKGDKDLLDVWEYCRSITIEELQQNYAKLNIDFDHYHGESMYRSSKSQNILELLKQKNLTKNQDDGRVVAVLDKNNVTLVKSDGSSLYISRDVAAAMDRKEQFNFDQMFYVVDNSQGIHFNNLFEILKKLDCDWSSCCHHIKFGKILGMSTRRGNLILMNDILEEAMLRMLENQNKSSNTRVTGDERKHAAEIVGISALIVADLQQRRTKDYTFSWDRALSDSGDTGVKLQYSHARLCSLLEKCKDLDMELESFGENLSEPIALELVFVIAQYDEILSKCFHTLEAFHLVKYLYQLCNTTSRAMKLLPVKTAADPDLAAARLKLFAASRKILADGLSVLGITPLTRM